MAEQWERREHRVVTYTGTGATDWAVLHRRLQEAVSEWRELAGVPPMADVPPQAVVVVAVGEVLTIRIEVRDGDVPAPAGNEPVEAPSAEGVSGDG